ncbi:MAG TPA: hypothetical protein VHR43_13430 [Gemmatimonadales bacterium]|nr:hypothetical protein [Gemmatimonadales bacterium]
MSGHVFHPGHQAFHGVTVVLETRGPRTYVGRFDVQDERGVHLHDVGVYDATAAGMSKAEFLRRCDRFGIRPEHRDLLVAADEVTEIRRLVDVISA